MLLFLPDWALPPNDPTNNGSLPTKVLEVDVSAFSHARDMFNNVSPSSCPHWKLKFTVLDF